MFSYVYYGVVAAIVVAAALCAWALTQQRSRRRHVAMQALLDNADRLEADLKACRDRLQKAHAVMSVSPDLPTSNEVEARQAVDSGLRALLRQRLWIRDQAPGASQQELDETVDALVLARRQLEPRLRALDDAQAALDAAVREHIHRDL